MILGLMLIIGHVLLAIIIAYIVVYYYQKALELFTSWLLKRYGNIFANISNKCADSRSNSSQEIIHINGSKQNDKGLKD